MTDEKQKKIYSAIRDYKYQLSSFMKDLESLEYYENEKENIKRREDYFTMSGLFRLLNEYDMNELYEELDNEMKRVEENLNSQKDFIKHKAHNLLQSVKRLKEFDIVLSSPVFVIAKRCL